MRYVLSLSAVVILGAMPTASFAETAQATITGTAPGSTISGVVHLTETDEGLHINASVSGTAPGKHGFHIHAFGSCADGGKAAGGHYNPEGVEHGYVPTDGLDKAHAGDLGNIEVAADSDGQLELTIAELTLTDGPYAVAGRAIILHADEDDFGQPTGHAGSRIGCGAIVIVGP